MRSSRHFKVISHTLIFAMLHLCWLTSYGYAEMFPTESTIEQPTQDETDRQRTLDLLDRQEVIDELEKYGITKEEASVRINSLSDKEVMEIAGRLGELPAGGVCIRTGSYTSPGCDSSDNGGALLAILLGVLALLALIYYLIRSKAEDDSPSSKEEPASVPVEEYCDMEIESCD